MISPYGLTYHMQQLIGNWIIILFCKKLAVVSKITYIVLCPDLRAQADCSLLTALLMIT